MSAIGPILDAYLRAAVPPVRGLSDAELLARFRRDRDGEAFAELVRRHGPLVLGVCRRALRDETTADDAFQATFLALARDPRAATGRSTAAPWLYRVALRTARRMARGVPPTADPTTSSGGPPPDEALSAAELWTGLDDELSRLPERLRAPLVLCYLDGLTRDEAAERLGWSVATLKRRLEAGRGVLRARLTRRGLAPALLAAATVPGLRAAVPARLADRVVGVAVATPIRSGIPLAVYAVAALASVGLVIGLGAGTQGGPKSPPPKDPPSAKAAVDDFGDPLPPGAVARLGTARHRAANAHVAVTPDGKTVVTAGDDLVVRTFDAATGDTKEVRRLDGPVTRHTALSADGRYLAGVTYPKPETIELCVWDTMTGERIARLDLKDEGADAVAVHGPTKTVAFTHGTISWPARPRHLRLWSFAGDKPPATLRQVIKKDSASYTEDRSLFSPDGSKLLTHLPDGQLVCWDVASGTALWEQALKTVKHFFFRPDGKYVVIAPNGNGFEFWGAADGTKVADSTWSGRGLKDGYAYWPIAASPDGKFVALFHGQRRLALCDVAARKIVREIDDPLRVPGEAPVGFWAPPTTVAFTPDGSGLVWRSSTVQRWDTGTGKPAWTATWDRGHTEAVTRLRFSPDGRALASAGKDAVCYVWDVPAGKPRHRFPKGWGDLFAFGPDSRTLVTGSVARQPPAVWDLATGRPARTLAAPGELTQYSGSSDREAAVTPDGRRIVTLTDNSFAQARVPPGRVLTTWDLAPGAGPPTERVVADTVDVAVLAPDGGSFALFHVNRPGDGIGLVPTADGGRKRTLPDPDVPARGDHGLSCELAFSPDSRFLATRLQTEARTDFPVRVWDCDTATLFRTIPAAGPARIAFAGDGRTMTVATTDGLRGYELATGREAFRVAAAIDPGGVLVDAVAVAPDGRTVATGHRDGTILVWDATGRKDMPADQAWAALAEPTAGLSGVWSLAATPDAAVPLIRDRLPPAKPDPQVAALVRDLDSDTFRVREAAAAKLAALGAKARAGLRAGLAGTPTAEGKERIEKLLASLDPLAPRTGSDLVETRAVQVLEVIATPAARAVLTHLAAGDPGALVTTEAAAALKRMKDR
jgi:RNA polymerase sigma factor (sigma-70 family)